MHRLRAAVAELETIDDIDPRELSGLIDRLQAVLCRVVRDGVKRGDHLIEGKTPCGWVAETCRVSGTSAADRLRVGEELEKLPAIHAALRSGEIGFQATAVICHLSNLLAEKGEQIVEADWVGYARQFSIKNLRRLAEHARFLVDPDGAERDAEEDYEQRYLYLSELGSMYKLDAVLDREGGMALKTALETLTKRLGPADERTPKQRRADALKEIVFHALDQGTLPKRHGARPHLSVHTTPDGLHAELADGSPISRQAAQRLACDGVMQRVLKAESVVIDVGRAKRTAQPAQGSPRNHGAGAPAGPTPHLRRTRLRAADRLDERPPCRVLVAGWGDQPPQAGAALLLPPPPGPRRWLAGGPRRRAGGVHATRYAGDAEAPLRRKTLGGLGA